MEESIEGRIEEDGIVCQASAFGFVDPIRCITKSIGASLAALGIRKKFKREHAGVSFAVGGQWVKMGEGPHNPKLSAMRPNTHYGTLFFAKGGHHHRNVSKRLVGNLCCPTLDVSLSIIGAPQH